MRLLKAFFAASLAFNLSMLCAGIYVIHREGGVEAVRNQLVVPSQRFVWHTRESLFESVSKPATAPIVMLGDSITELAEWQEMLGADVLNRGIFGDDCIGVLKRANTVASLQPKAVFLMIGTNNISSRRAPPEEIAAQVQQIIVAIRYQSPHTIVFLQSILPTAEGRAERITETNSQLRNLTDGKTVRWVDLYPLFADHGFMRSDLSVDGRHPNGKGYAVWCRAIAPLIEEVRNSKQI